LCRNYFSFLVEYVGELGAVERKHEKNSRKLGRKAKNVKSPNFPNKRRNWEG